MGPSVHLEDLDSRTSPGALAEVDLSEITETGWLLKTDTTAGSPVIVDIQGEIKHYWI